MEEPTGTWMCHDSPWLYCTSLGYSPTKNNFSPQIHTFWVGGHTALDDLATTTDHCKTGGPNQCKFHRRKSTLKCVKNSQKFWTKCAKPQKALFLPVSMYGKSENKKRIKIKNSQIDVNYVIPTELHDIRHAQNHLMIKKRQKCTVYCPKGPWNDTETVSFPVASFQKFPSWFPGPHLYKNPSKHEFNALKPHNAH